LIPRGIAPHTVSFCCLAPRNREREKRERVCEKVRETEREQE